MIAAALWVLLSQAADADNGVLLTNARIITVSDAVVEKGSIQIQGGRIVRIGDAPEEGFKGRVIDLTGKTVIPGLILGASALGIAGNINEEGEEIAPGFRILDSFDRSAADLSRARQSGITAALVEPGNRGVIGGVGSVVKTGGVRGTAQVLIEDAVLKAAMGLAPAQGNFAPRGTSATFYTRRPTTRMGVAWEFKKAFADAAREPQPGALQKTLAGTMTLRVSAARVTDLDTALQLADEFKLKLTLEEAQEAFKRAELLASRKIPVFLRPVPPPATTEPEEYRLDTFMTLIRAGVQTALLPASDQKSDGLMASVAFAVRHGATPAEALRAVTLTPAEILGVAGRVGSLAAGKDADLVVLSGPPHEITSRVEKVMIDGRWIHGEGTER
jgi:imidazolonepropionase-like amidohydrolase